MILFLYLSTFLDTSQNTLLANDPLCSYSTQRPLKTIAIKSCDVYIPRGVSVPPLDKDILWEFQPKKLGNCFLTASFVLVFKLVFVQIFYGEQALIKIPKS